MLIFPTTMGTPTRLSVALAAAILLSGGSIAGEPAAEVARPSGLMLPLSPAAQTSGASCEAQGIFAPMALPKSGSSASPRRPTPGLDAFMPIPDGYRSASGRHKLKLTGAPASVLKAAGAGTVYDYGSFQVVDVDAKAAASLKALSLGEPEYLDYQNLIQIGQRLFDTTDPAYPPQADATSPSGQWIVQFAGPIKDEWYQSLENTGATIVSYLPSNAYVVAGSESTLARVRAFAREASHVQWHGPVLIEDKLTGGAHLQLKSLRPGDTTATGLYTVQVLRETPTSLQTRALIDNSAAGRVVSEYDILGYTNITLPLRVDSLRQIAARPDVVVIEAYLTPSKLDERQNMIVAGNVSGNAPIPGDYFSLLASWGFTQAQFTASNFGVDVSDSGLDNAITTPNHFGLRLGGAIGGTSRVAYVRLEGTANAGSTLQGCDGHGNLNAHIVGGHTGSRTTAPHVDAQGFRYGLGVNPYVNRIGSSVIFDPNTFTNPNLPNLQSRAFQDGMRISTNSWGSTAGGAYTISSQSYDALTRDAQPTGSAFANAGNQPMIMLFAAGNSGPGANTTGAPGTAKNVITVGASENVHPFGGADQCGTADSGADNFNDIIGFSSRGPTDDGRIKPEIVAPGTHVSGGVFQATHSDAGNGAAGACFDAGGVCAGPGTSNFWPLGQQFYTASSGTSHSTPAVAGGASLVYQQFLNNPSYLADRIPAGSTPPSPAMVKAYLTNAARHLTGVSANDNLYSNNQGMGLMDLGRSFDATPRILRDQNHVIANTGDSRSFFGTVTDATRPFRVSLAWTDAPGATTGNSFNNNLDLTVTIGGATYRGNVFSGGLSVTGGAADFRNNLESVFLPAGFPVGTPFAVTITATNINGNGVPNDAAGDATDQDYALVVYNGATATVPVITATATLVGGSCPANGVTPDPGESLTLDIALRNIGNGSSGPLSAQILNQNGVTLASAVPVSYGVLGAGGAAVTRTHGLRVDPALVCGAGFTPVIRLNDGASLINQDVSIPPIPTGATAIVLSEDFDGVTAPALPAGWVATRPLGTVPFWATTTSAQDSPLNAIFTGAPATPSDNRIDSPTLALPASPSAAVLTFRHRYNFANRFDGGVLEISIAGGPFADLLTAGGSFLEGGYNDTLRNDLGLTNPLAGRSAWTGNIALFSSVTATLPVSASGQNVVLRWRSGTDDLVGALGWWVDSIQLRSGRQCILGCLGTTLTISDVAVTEGNTGVTAMSFDITRSKPAGTQSVTAQTITGGTADAPADYSAVGPTSIVFTGTDSTRTLTVNVNGDFEVEPPETVFAQLAVLTGGVSLTDADGIGTITNDDTAGVTVSESGGSTAVTEGGVPDTYTVVLTSQPTANVTVTLSPSAQLTTGLPQLVFGPGNWNVAQSVAVSAVDDGIVEGPQSGTVAHTVTSADANYNGLPVAPVAVSIADNNSATVQFNPTSVSRLESAGPMAFTVTLSNPVQSGVTVTVNSAPGTATSPADFTAISNQTVSFAPNSTASQTVNVTIANDALDENDENFTLTLSGLTATGNVTLPAGTATATGTILDDDALPVLSIANVTQPEGNATNTLTFTVNLSPVSGRAVSFTRATADGTAVSTAPNADFVAIPSGIVTIPAGQTSVTIPVTINGDTVPEGNESFSLNLTSVSNATPGSITASGTLTDDDQQSTTTTITADLPDPSVVGQPYPVAVEVRAQTLPPLGTVSIIDGTGASCSAPLTAGTGALSTMTCTLTSTTAGNKTLTATYAPANTAFGASSDTESHRVDPAATTLALVGPPTVRFNTPASYTATLAVTAPGAGTPAGSVTVTSGAQSCTITLPTATPSCTLSFPTLGSRTVNAAFVPANGDFLGASATPIQTLAFASTDLVVTKDNGVTTYEPNDLLVYTVEAENRGPDGAPSVRILDPVPTGLSSVAWTCAAQGGAICPSTSGTGGIDVVVQVMPSSSRLVFTYSGTVQGSPPEIVNIARAELPANGTLNDPAPGNETATDIDRLNRLHTDGFEPQPVNAPAGAVALPAIETRANDSRVAWPLVDLRDRAGLAVRVYVRTFDDAVEYALATRGSDDRLRLGPWQRYPVTPTLRWTAAEDRGGWRVTSARLD